MTLITLSTESTGNKMLTHTIPPPVRNIFSMKTAAFSPSDSIHDLLAPTDLHNLHPDEGVQNAKAYITAPVDMNHPVLQHIMTNIQQIGQQFPNFQLFNPKIMLAGRIKVPKKLFKQIQ